MREEDALRVGDRSARRPRPTRPAVRMSNIQAGRSASSDPVMRKSLRCSMTCWRTPRSRSTTCGPEVRPMNRRVRSSRSPTCPANRNVGVLSGRVAAGSSGVASQARRHRRQVRPGPPRRTATGGSGTAQRKIPSGSSAALLRCPIIDSSGLTSPREGRVKSEAEHPHGRSERDLRSRPAQPTAKMHRTDGGARRPGSEEVRHSAYQNKPITGRGSWRPEIR